MKSPFILTLVLSLTLAGSPSLAEEAPPAAASAPAPPSDDKVSYYKDIRPIFQAKCHGCHQPAKDKGDYVMTSHDRLLSGGEEGEAIIPGNPDASYLVDQIVPVDGKAEMPKKDDPLHTEELALVRKWIAQGAVDDTPENARQRFDAEHPPSYTKPPIVTSLEFSPDGKLIAVAGFHEILLHNADGSGLVARLVGLSERIESVRFSPDGTKIAATGGLPGRMGEVQVWDVAKRKLELSVPVTHDTVYGVSWSPDGKLVAFGCTDNSVRVIDAATGKQVLYQGAHNDWVLDTSFSVDGKHLISVGRDMAAKLIEVETERFVDNITSVTPGALKGGIASVVRHPTRNEILVGGSDGTPQTYRLFRETARKIGDNANLLRRFPAMEGRVWSVAYGADGKQIAAGSSLNGKGAVNIYSGEYDLAMSKEVAAIYSKPARLKRAEAEQKTLDDFHTSGTKLLHKIPFTAPIYAVTFSPDGKTVAATGGDGQVHLIDAASGKIRNAFLPVTLDDSPVPSFAKSGAAAQKPVNLAKGKPAPDKDESLPQGSRVTALQILPESIDLSGPTQYNQLLVTAQLASGESADVTRLVAWSLDNPVLEITSRGRAEPKEIGNATLTATLGAQTATASVNVAHLDQQAALDFVRDVNPVISRLGCNAGTCHGAKDGKNGFKLSLRGYDPLFDVRAFADDHAARRINLASADDSLMLLKATGAVPHEGQQITHLNSTYYKIIRDWIAAGTPLDTATPKVQSIELFPKNPVLKTIGSRQQIRVVASYPDGSQRDVTAEAYIESGNTDVAVHDDFGLLTTVRRGEAPILARFEGAYAATTVTVMGDRSSFQWADQPANNEIDTLVAAKWQRMKILPSPLCTDTEFIRRVYLDLTGLPPSPDAVRAFTADQQPTRQKRDALVDQLIGSPEFVEHWANKWADKLMVNSKFLGREGAVAFRAWIRENVEKNTPYNKFVHSILTASGSTKENPAASYYKILRTPEEIMENTTHLFLATRFNCNKCHDHPFERWTQDQYYETAAYFAQVGLKTDPASGDKKVGGTAVEEARPLYEIAFDLAEGEMKHERTGAVTPPEFPYQATTPANAQATRREQLAAWLTSADNQYFAMSYANRLWGYLLGTGIIEPLDDIRASNPPSNPDLLNWLTSEFINSNFNARHIIQLICKSRTYQLSIAANQWNEDDEINFSHAKARRLPAEVLFDAVYAATGSTPNIPGAKPGMRAAELPDVALDLKSGFLANLGRPPRVSACECERSNDVQLGSVMALLSGPAIADAVGDPKNAIATLVAATPDDDKLIDEIYLRVLNRPATPAEVEAVKENWTHIERDHQALIMDLAKKEAEHVPIRAAREKTRLIDIGKAQGALDTYLPEYNKKKAEAEAARQARLQAAEKALADYTAGNAEKKPPSVASLPVSRLWTKWQPLTPATVNANNKVELVIEGDGSIFNKGGPRPTATDFDIRFRTNLENITGILLEVMPDDRLPNYGPGRAEGSNFVLTEIQAYYWPAPAQGQKPQPANAKFAAAAAEFSQPNYDINTAIDGNFNAGNANGWAIHGQERRPHWGRFQFEKPIGSKDGLTLQLKLFQRYQDRKHQLGRFRIWATTSSDPLGLGLPADIHTALSLPAEQRNETQKAAIANYERHTDPHHHALAYNIFKEKRPIPADPRFVQLQSALTNAQSPVLDDPGLVHLRNDVTMSTRQSANERLTAAQDLAWALINNPAFLFNH